MVQIYPVGTSSALEYAVKLLTNKGFSIVDHPTPEVTHLLLDVPSFQNNGRLRSGAQIEKILETVPQYITVVGGNLDHPALESYQTWDFLQQESYLADNAAITADCAIQVATPLLSTTLVQTPTLIIGWGRIGKCLAQMLKALGTSVTVAARKESDRAMLKAMGFEAVNPAKLTTLEPYRLLINTAPEPILEEDILKQSQNCIKIDLASRKGLAGEDIIWARGLPGIYAPESSGRLIGETFLQFLKEEI